MSLEVVGKDYDRNAFDEGQGLVDGPHSNSGPHKQVTKYTADEEDLLPVVLEKYLERAGVM